MPSKWTFSLWSFLAGILAATALIGVFAAMCLRDGFSARQKAGTFETALAHFALHNSVSAHQRALANPVALSTEAIAAARDHFADHCASCHANNGSGHSMYGDGLNPPPPDLRLEATQSEHGSGSIPDKRFEALGPLASSLIFRILRTRGLELQKGLHLATIEYCFHNHMLSNTT
jgi:mono/diheme cytochrome c family protein